VETVAIFDTLTLIIAHETTAFWAYFLPNRPPNFFQSSCIPASAYLLLPVVSFCTLYTMANNNNVCLTLLTLDCAQSLTI
jgi:hypothetical protein